MRTLWEDMDYEDQLQFMFDYIMDKESTCTCCVLISEQPLKTKCSKISSHSDPRDQHGYRWTQQQKLGWRIKYEM